MLRREFGAAPRAYGCVALVIVLSLGLSPASARAEEPLSAGASAYQEGLRRAAAGHWNEARVSFLEAWREGATIELAANLGRAELMAGHYADAATHLAFVVTNGDKLSPADQTAAKTLFNRARGQVATLVIEVDRPGCDVSLDGSPLGTSPLIEAVFVDPGERKVEASLPGRQTVSRALLAKAGDEVRVTLHVPPEASSQDTSPPPSGPSRVLVGLGLGATVAAATTGVAALIAANGESTTMDELRARSATDPTCAGCYRAFEDAGDRFARDRAWAIGGFVAAGAFAVATAAYIGVSSTARRDARSSIHLVVPANTSGAGAMWVGTF